MKLCELSFGKLTQVQIDHATEATASAATANPPIRSMRTWTASPRTTAWANTTNAHWRKSARAATKITIAADAVTEAVIVHGRV